MKRYALVLSGGAFNGAFQLGALRYLAQHWSDIQADSAQMHFDIVAGVSVGSLNGALIAQDRLDLLEQLWEEVAERGTAQIYTSAFIDTESDPEEARITLDVDELKRRLAPNWEVKVNLGSVAKFLFNRKKLIDELFTSFKSELEENLPKFKSLADNGPLQDKIAQNITRTGINNTEYYVGFVSLQDGRYYSIEQSEFKSDAAYQQAVLASTVMPIVWEPVEHIDLVDKEIAYAVDGGIKNVSPLGDVVKAIMRRGDPEEYTVIIMNSSNGEMQSKDMSRANIASIALRSLAEITINEIFNNDIAEYLRINDIISQVSDIAPGVEIYDYHVAGRCRTDTPLVRINTILVQPDSGVLGDGLMANRQTIDRRVAHGMQKMREALELYDPEGGGYQQCIV